MPPQDQTPQEPEQSLKSRMSSFEWSLLLGLFLFIDGVQILLDALAIGEIVNRLDFVIGLALGFYLYMRGYKFDTNDWLWLAGSVIAEEIPLVDAAPFWTLDVWRFRKKDLARAI